MPTPGRQPGSRRLLAAVLVLWSAASCSPLARAASAPTARAPGPAGPLATPVPARSALATPTPSPTAPEPTSGWMPARRLTESGCCVSPFWSPDSRWVAYVDLPASGSLAEVLAVPADGGDPRLAFTHVGVVSADWTLLAYPQAGRTFVEFVASSERWAVPNEGRGVWLSPAGHAVAWEIGSRGITHPDLRERAIWVANADGSGAEEWVRLWGGGFVGWTNGGQDVIVSGRLQAEGPSGLWRIERDKGRAVLLVEAEQPRDPLLSPSGEWLAFYQAFDSGPGENGLWIVRTDGSQVSRIDLFGAYRWRRDGQLLVIPLDVDGPGAAIWQVDAASGAEARLTNPWQAPLHISGNDWQVSPDGSMVVFLSSVDRSLWVLDLPMPSGS